MNMLVTQLALKISGDPISPDWACYRPPHWPPPDDWVVSVDLNGIPVSRWREPSWDYSVQVGRSFVLKFTGGHHPKVPPLGSKNEQLLRLATTWIMWGSRGSQSWSSIDVAFSSVRRIVVLCEHEGITADQLSKFPRLFPKVIGLFPSKHHKKRVLVLLDRLFRAREEIGFVIFDEIALRYFSRHISESADDEHVQTAYIPPRIWVYQVQRLRLFLDDFIAHKRKIEACFEFCVKAYEHNFGSLENAVSMVSPSDTYLPFTKQKKGAGKWTKRESYGRFETTAENYGIAPLLKRWVGSGDNEDIDVRSLSTYFTLVQNVGLAYVLNFTFQRLEEAAGLRSDCLLWEENSVLGRYLIVRGETTKTDPDSDAWWPTSPHVEVAIEAISTVARMRVRCAEANSAASCSDDDKANPYLFHGSFEPWSTSRRNKPYAVRPVPQSYQSVIKGCPALFDDEELRITEEDMRIAKMFTPNLEKMGKFTIGEKWPLAWHCLRRTGAVNMFASGLLSNTSIQVILKHLTVLQTQYYGANYSRMRLNGEYEQLTIAARYEVVAKQIQALTSDRYVSPLGMQRKQEIVELVKVNEFRALVKAARKGEVTFRATRLGGCAKRGDCEYGGIESVSPCAGGDGRKPCREALFDSEKRESVKRQLAALEREIEQAKPGSPRVRKLEIEANGLRNFLNVIDE